MTVLSNYGHFINIFKNYNFMLIIQLKWKSMRNLQQNINLYYHYSKYFVPGVVNVLSQKSTQSTSTLNVATLLLYGKIKAKNFFLFFLF